MFFAVSVTSQVDVRVSTALFLQSSTISELFPVFQALCFFDHLVMVTLSSTCTSLTSDSEEWMLSSSMIGRAEGVEGEKEGLSSGNEWVPILAWGRGYTSWHFARAQTSLGWCQLGQAWPVPIDLGLRWTLRIRPSLGLKMGQKVLGLHWPRAHRW